MPKPQMESLGSPTFSSPTGSWVPQHMASILLAAVLGFLLAVVATQSPLIGMGLVGGLAVSFVLTRRAEFPFALLVFSFAIPIQKTVAGIPINMSDAVVVLWGMTWPVFMMRHSAPRLKIPFLFWAALPFVLCAFASQFVAYNPGAAIKQVLRLTEWFLVLPVLMAALKPTPGFWRAMLGVFLIVPPLFALDGVSEVLNNGRSISHMLGIPVPVPSKEFSDIRHTFDVSGRAGSTFGGAQGLAMYLVMMLSVITAVFVYPPTPRLRLLAGVSMALCFVGLYVAKSRGGFLGAAALMMVILLFSRPRYGFAALMAGVVLIFAALMALFFWQGWDGTLVGLIPGRHEAVSDRLIIWGRAIEIFLAHPILGVGFGNFHDVVYQEGGIVLGVPLGYESLHCHNTYLEVLTGLGIVGFGAYLGMLGACLTRLIRFWVRRPGQFPDCFVLAGIAAIAAYMVFGMVDMIFVQNMHFILASIISLGLLATMRASGGEAAQGEGP
ncbi:MAG TPA: O-antigen ligase family protein [Alphaproteobacteria bacterium]|nr:O-antigen ligase family protein [Alphaproteobacteria bacterium]